MKTPPDVLSREKKSIVAFELSMKGYDIEDIASQIMMIYRIHYKEAKKIAIKGKSYSMPGFNLN